MEPFDAAELSDQELDGLLRQWEAPAAPPVMRAALFPQRPVRWWRRSVRVPLPVAACVVLLLAAGAWRLVEPHRVEAPTVVRTLRFDELRPVTELRPRIIRSGHVEN